MKNNIIPIINENDSVSTEEIQFGDNDQLSAILAKNLAVDHLIILTNTNGVLDQNDQVIPFLKNITDKELSLVKDSKSSVFSKGGMRSKLLAAKIAMEANVIITIANGRTENVIHNVLNGKQIGTLIKKIIKLMY